ncbi:GNAT family N-acetyltransferase [Enterovirga aerilata]|uniref:GNAT family N-acetyltransferase n=1 Tax=Enterovirga aerilata TaxID=2730920 RepID=A0A849I5D6_9HYPH|nr:GNAT family N-acetyltransferase [Enterovirga sp. DB1703]NNM71257.1 GNAT family N-acetyltransferase [Enterovirga sp. DB1703]
MGAEAPEIRVLGPQDAADYRALRLFALECEPEAFSADLEEARGHGLDWFRNRLDLPPPSATFGAFFGGTLVGAASLIVETSRKMSHRGLVAGVFVSPEARGRGVAARLLGGLVDHATDRLDVLDLAVGTYNAPARALYLRLGFTPYGLMRDALRVNGRSIDEEMMSLDLRTRARRPASD